MRHLAIIIATLLTASCNNGSADGYWFERAEWVQTSFQTRIVLVRSRETLLKLAPAEAQVQGAEIQAFSLITENGRVCTIYTLHPSVRYEPQWAGHELTHCVFGRWHPNQKGA